MIQQQHVSVIIPALNEEQAIPKVVSGLKALRNGAGQALIDDIIVCDNGSTDRTAEVAQQAGARTVFQATPGYGIACLTAIKHLGNTDIVLFVDGDDSVKLAQANSLLETISKPGGPDMVIGSRTLGAMEKGALTLPQRFGNWLAARLIRLMWHYHVTDLGPFRAIRHEALKALDMQDKQFGWTVEMQIKAIQQGLTTAELPVDSTRRIGESKISGTLRGVIGAAQGILGTIFKLRLARFKLRRVQGSPKARHSNSHAVYSNVHSSTRRIRSSTRPIRDI